LRPGSLLRAFVYAARGETSFDRLTHRPVCDVEIELGLEIDQKSGVVRNEATGSPCGGHGTPKHKIIHA
jgi:hypothetical protein